MFFDYGKLRTIILSFIAITSTYFLLSISYHSDKFEYEPDYLDTENSYQNQSSYDSIADTFGYNDKLAQSNQSIQSLKELTDSLRFIPKFNNFNHNNKEEHLKNILKRGSRLSYHFDECRMENCFDFSRCPKNKKLSVAIISHEESLKQQPKPLNTSNYPKENKSLDQSQIIYSNILDVIRNSSYYETNSSKACIFVPSENTLDRDPLSPGYQDNIYNLIGSHNRFGINYLIFNLYSGTWPNYKENNFSGFTTGAAIIAKASTNTIFHRKDYDISFPLFSYLHPVTTSRNDSYVAETLNKHRRILLSFKGKRYVIGCGSETRNGLHHINNNYDVIMLTTCKHGKKWKDSSDKLCEKEELRYGSRDFLELMKDSSFCLVPRGRRLGSFRHLEAMSNGCIPVILSDDWLQPFSELIDWSCLTLHYLEKALLLVPELLRDINGEARRKMRNCCLDIYDKYFSSVEKITLTTLRIIENRIINHYKKEEATRSSAAQK